MAYGELFFYTCFTLFYNARRTERNVLEGILPFLAVFLVVVVLVVESLPLSVSSTTAEDLRDSTAGFGADF